MIINESYLMVKTLDWVKSLRVDIRRHWRKGWNIRDRQVGGKIVLQIHRNEENGGNTLLTHIRWRKKSKRNI